MPSMRPVLSRAGLRHDGYREFNGAELFRAWKHGVDREPSNDVTPHWKRRPAQESRQIFRFHLSVWPVARDPKGLVPAGATQFTAWSWPQRTLMQSSSARGRFCLSRQSSYSPRSSPLWMRMTTSSMPMHWVTSSVSPSLSFCARSCTFSSEADPSVFIWSLPTSP